MNSAMGRRAFLQATGTLGLLGLLPGCARSLSASSGAAAGGSSAAAGKFLTAHELDTLRAVAVRFVPGPPEDTDPGAAEAGVAEAIDRLLAAFTVPVPPIHAGGPYSNRAGAAHDDFADFVPMDAFAELGWRIRIEGSQGLAAREFAGPVTGLQEIYRNGLARLDARAQQLGAADFISLAAPAQDLLLSDQSDSDVQALAGAALAQTLEAMYGPPEYGGNKNLAGWAYTGWAGDSQPRGYTDDEVTQPGDASLLPPMSANAAALFAQIVGAIGVRGAPRARWWLNRGGW